MLLWPDPRPLTLDKNGAWHLPLARELKAAGLSIDLNKAL